ncbi:MAG TPA: GIY-YIG nuclease family protein [Candidatus Bipolaricaulota bacterium]|nr:GIY-YIG nuclease family protein [Candidatus Bipolaricaulota bacterium]
MLANKRNGTLYTGVTNDLARRLDEHKNDVNESFTKRYQVHTLVYFEEHECIDEAIWREKCIKKWRRKWKLALIEKENPDWRDLSNELI